MSEPRTWYATDAAGGRRGPLSDLELGGLIQSRQIGANDLLWAPHLESWTPLRNIPELAYVIRQPPSFQGPAFPIVAEGAGVIQSIRSLEQLSAIVWLVIGIFQVLLGFAVPLLFIPGIWNLVAAVTRFNLLKSIEARRGSVVAHYESIAPLVIILVVNLVIGGILGALWVIVDFVIRDKVLTNRHLFDQ